MDRPLIAWDSHPPNTDATVEEIGHFTARGMRLVYGRVDHFGRHHTFRMDIWISHNQRLLMRCWSRCEDIEWRSFEIKGVDAYETPEPDKKRGFLDSWVPEAARNVYYEWIQEEL